MHFSDKRPVLACFGARFSKALRWEYTANYNLSLFEHFYAGIFSLSFYMTFTRASEFAISQHLAKTLIERLFAICDLCCSRAVTVSHRFNKPCRTFICYNII